MYPGETNRSEPAFSLREELAGLRSRLDERERTVSGLTSIVERQAGMMERYDAVIHAPGRNDGEGAARDTLAGVLDRALALLDQAVAGGERRAIDVASLQAQLDRALQLLDQSLRNQEAMAARAQDPVVASPAIEETLAKYDQMLERSLEALETAYRATQSSRQEVCERDRLLKRTLDLLESSVESGNGTQRRSGLFGRLFA